MDQKGEKTSPPPQSKSVGEFLSKAAKQTYYQILNVQQEADELTIKRAYRRLALQFHPDKNTEPGADEAFKIISRAFACLSDPVKRRQYDAHGCFESPHHSTTFRRGSHHNNGSYEFGGDVSPEELFQMFFREFAGGAGHSSPFSPIFMRNFQFGNGPGFNSHHPFSSFPHGQGRRRGREVPPTLVELALQFIPALLMAFVLFLSGLASSTANTT